MDSWPHGLTIIPKHNAEGEKGRAKEKYLPYFQRTVEKTNRKWALNLNFYLTEMFSEPQLSKKPHAPPTLSSPTQSLCSWGLLALTSSPYPGLWFLLLWSITLCSPTVASTMMLTCSANFWLKEQSSQDGYPKDTLHKLWFTLDNSVMVKVASVRRCWERRQGSQKTKTHLLTLSNYF